MRFFIFIFFILLQVNAKNLPWLHKSAVSDAPVIELFISFGCKFCYQSLVDLLEYLKTCSKVNVVVYYFCPTEGDKEKVQHLLATKDKEKLLQLAKILLPLKNIEWKNDKSFKEFIERNPEIIEAIKKNKAQYILQIKKMQERFFNANIDKTPSWIINNTYLIEGAVDSLGQLLDSVKNI